MTHAAKNKSAIGAQMRYNCASFIAAVRAGITPRTANKLIFNRLCVVRRFAGYNTFVVCANVVHILLLICV